MHRSLPLSLKGGNTNFAAAHRENHVKEHAGRCVCDTLNAHPRYPVITGELVDLLMEYDFPQHLCTCPISGFETVDGVEWMGNEQAGVYNLHGAIHHLASEGSIVVSASKQAPFE